MFKVTGNLTGVRISGATQPEVITTSTMGNIRINPLASRALGIKAKDFVGIIELTDEDGNKVPALFIGKEGQGGVAKVAPSNGKVSSTLQFSSASAWVALKGNDSKLKAYKLGDAVETGDEAYPKAWPLTFIEERDKVVRESKASA